MSWPLSAIHARSRRALTTFAPGMEGDFGSRIPFVWPAVGELPVTETLHVRIHVSYAYKNAKNKRNFFNLTRPKLTLGGNYYGGKRDDIVHALWGCRDSVMVRKECGLRTQVCDNMIPDLPPF
uniref:Uncharacterized protein n=1 Tax=Cannabis sativa TaxID=3483 RepID=A0A803PT96_CANSA